MCIMLKMSLSGWIYIIWLTIKKVITGSDVNANAQQTVETFNGKN